jgi:hypothetical protein
MPTQLRWQAGPRCKVAAVLTRGRRHSQLGDGLNVPVGSTEQYRIVLDGTILQ